MTGFKQTNFSVESNPPLPPPPLQISENDVHQVLRKNKRRKAPGLDGVTPACLKTSSDQLAPIFSQIFNRSLELCEGLLCFKRSTIIPVPKKTKIRGLNDYKPVALTSVVMKSFEKLVLAYLKNITRPLLDPLQPGSYVSILFVDFSSAFNTIIPTLLQTKLNQLSVPSSVCQWITSFLTDRKQLVRLGKLMSSSRTTNTGAPQGCILSPLLFSLYTNDCTSKDPSDGEESAYRQEVKELAVWCSHNNLELNTLKNVEMIVDFRRNPPALSPLSIMDSTVATLSKFNLPQELLKQFYSTITESVLCTSITVWFGSATKSDIRRLQRKVRTAERIVGAPLPTLQELYSSRIFKIHTICEDQNQIQGFVRRSSSPSLAASPAATAINPC
ncbi:hypothetical protein H4Q32_028923 [Labeo rohita]|uniref:Reverse transcriptase domain-containing protein n=1 Tax=Labeo rohita TaxID=84645 RepID=A0ABQ8L7R9_LABRO|nr:hypothetical protein H4Q32_028923 [Labeo rohita]